jgi:hypothetical protein
MILADQDKDETYKGSNLEEEGLSLFLLLNYFKN